MKKYISIKKVFILLAVMVIIVILGFYRVYTLNIAHSSFENYYVFRGCVQLIEKTDIYAKCKLSSGDTIKLINIKDKWYLDGDGPGVF